MSLEYRTLLYPLYSDNFTLLQPVYRISFLHPEIHLVIHFIFLARSLGNWRGFPLSFRMFLYCMPFKHLIVLLDYAISLFVCLTIILFIKIHTQIFLFIYILLLCRYFSTSCPILRIDLFLSWIMFNRAFTRFFI